MPHPHFDSVISSLVEPWFYGNPRSAGMNYGRLLTDKFGTRTDKDAVDSGLGLGAYLVHSETNKRQRTALRAVMCAHVLMRNEPASRLPALKKQYESLALDALKRAFIGQFPILQNDPNRVLWGPGNFSDPILLPELRIKQSWVGKAVPKYTFIVHTNEFPETPSAVFADPIAELSKYSASSFSLLDNRKPFTYFPQGLIFKVPANNILVTYQADLMSALRENSAHGPTFVKHTFAEEITELSMASSSGKLLSPASVIAKQDPSLQKASIGVKSKYNELLICGKASVPLPHGVTGALALKGLFISIKKNGDIAGAPYNAEERHEACKRLARLHKVPLLYLPNEV
jgi:hypothetical protein